MQLETSKWMSVFIVDFINMIDVCTYFIAIKKPFSDLRDQHVIFLPKGTTFHLFLPVLIPVFPYNMVFYRNSS